MNRRSFLLRTASLSLAAAAPAVNRAAGKPKRDSTNDAPRFIDIHTHLGAFYPGRELTADRLVGFMDKHNVERSCVLPLISPEAAPIPQPTSIAIAACQKYPDRIIPFCAVDGRAVSVPPKRPGHVRAVKGLVDILKRYRDAGCRGLGEHKTGLAFDAPQNMYLYEACAEVGFPILFHLDDIRNSDTPGLPRLERVLKAFPGLNLIGHAAGFWASISGDATEADFGRYPKVPSPVKPGGALDRLLAKHPNLHCDLSEPGGYRAIARDPDFGCRFLIRHADQMIFGTDVLMPDQYIPQFELYASLDLPADVRQRIYRGNALRLLKLEGR